MNNKLSEEYDNDFILQALKLLFPDEYNDRLETAKKALLEAEAADEAKGEEE